ncbi:MAG: helix-turn-helix domain-containing protein [Oscillospiraceae bacterium]|nr:helix-turn-helix domain-containing protein [Oscillospiraceae bacterium]
MTNKIGEKIKNLRKKSNVTQEKLADYLGISFQSVSRWESGVCYPDLEILPAIANYFSVTTDELLGVDIMNKRGRKREILGQYKENFSKGLVEENITMLRSAINEFPNEYNLLSHLAFCLGIKSKRDKESEAYKESTAIYERIWKDCPDNKIRYNIIEYLARRYKDMGEKGKAMELAFELPVITLDDVLGELYEGEEKARHFKYQILKNCDVITRNIASNFAQAKYSDDTYMIGVQKRIELNKKAIGIFEIIYEKGDYGYCNEEMAGFYLNVASNYVLLQDFDNALDCLEKTVDYTIAYDTLPESFTHTSTIVEGDVVSKTQVAKITTANDSYVMLQKLSDEKYDPIRETERFRAVTAKLEQYAKKET